jgi:uncharacterized membrane protein
MQHRAVMRLLMAAFYFGAGALHLAAPEGFTQIVPAFVPWPEATVWLTGVCEIAGAIGLLMPVTRPWAGMALALYAVCVFPANINHAINGIAVGGLPTSWWYHGPRLLAQPVIVWWALYCSGAIDWPWIRKKA